MMLKRQGVKLEQSVSDRDEKTGGAEIVVGNCMVRPATNEIIRDGETLHLEPKSMEVLAYLVANAGDVVSRDELLEKVWPDVHVGDNSLTSAIIKIRRALGDNARDRRYVETIPKRGYRLIATIREISALPVVKDAPWSSSARRRISLAAFAALIVVAAGTAAIWRLTTSPSTGIETLQSPRHRIMVAVAPFVNASHDADQDYLSRGIADSILTDLARSPDLSVRRDDAEVDDASTSPAYRLEGSVLRSGDTIRIDSRLVERATGRILYSTRLDRPFADLLTIEDEIRDSVLGKLRQRINVAERSRAALGYTENVAAYDLFLRAQSKLLIRTRQANLAARTLYHDAISRDPNFARAYGGLALTYAAEYRNGWADDRPIALAAALKFAGTAISIAPDLPEQHWVVGYVKTQQRMYDEGRAALHTAINIDPHFADAYALSGGIETYRGNPAKTVPLLRQALRLNPDGGYLYYLLLARAYYFLGDFEQAQINLHETIARNPQNVEAHLYRAATLLRLAKTDDAAWEVDEVTSIEPDFTLDVWSESYPMARGKQLDGLLADLRRSGFS